MFGNVDKKFEVIGKKEDCDYGLLDEHGLINEGTQVNEKSILIGKYSSRSVDLKIFQIETNLFHRKKVNWGLLIKAL